MERTELLDILEEEASIIKLLLEAAMEQQRALITLNAGEIERLAAAQNELLARLQDRERLRWSLIAENLGISVKDASRLPMSEFDGGEKMADAESVRSALFAMMSQLHSINSTNRVLANRARNSARELVTYLTTSDTKVCDVRL